MVLDGEYSANEILVNASDVMLAEVTLQRFVFHPVHVSPPSSDVRRVRLFGLHIIDPGEQGIKINTNSAHSSFVDDGEIGC